MTYRTPYQAALHRRRLFIESTVLCVVVLLVGCVGLYGLVGFFTALAWLGGSGLVCLVVARIFVFMRDL